VQRLEGRPFALLGVSTNGSRPPELDEAMEKADLPWRSFADPAPAGAGPIARQWNLTTVPTLYLIDHLGVIRQKWLGAPDPAQLDEAIERCLRAAETK
jgi:hypothetical protein